MSVYQTMCKQVQDVFPKAGGLLCLLKHINSEFQNIPSKKDGLNMKFQSTFKSIKHQASFTINHAINITPGRFTTISPFRLPPVSAFRQILLRFSLAPLAVTPVTDITERAMAVTRPMAKASAFWPFGVRPMDRCFLFDAFCSRCWWFCWSFLFCLSAQLWYMFHTFIYNDLKHDGRPSLSGFK